MFCSYIMDKFHHHYSLTNSCTSKKSDFPSFEDRRKKIDDFNSRLQCFSLDRQRSKIRRFSMDRSAFFGVYIRCTINCISQYIKHMTKDAFSYRDADRSSSRNYAISSFETISRIHSNPSNYTIFQKLQNLNNDIIAITIWSFDTKCIIDSWDI